MKREKYFSQNTAKGEKSYDWEDCNLSGLIKIANIIQNVRGRKYPVINTEKCIGCGTCKRTCHHDAITGQKKEAHLIDAQKCFRCYHCMEKCPKGAINLTK